MTLHAEIETSKTIARQTVTAALQYNSFRLVIVHDALDDWLEDRLVGLIVDAVAKREVDCIILSCTDTYVTQLARTREVFAVLVE
jgi:hypothetical protein